ncbi:MAG: hypothetical protein R2864_14335 [Syntrophotaleaceae bacterium]
MAQIARLKEIPASEVEILKIIKQELVDIRERFAMRAAPRDYKRKDRRAFPGRPDCGRDMVVTVSHSGYIKRNAVFPVSRPAKGGKGKTGMRPKEEDFVEQLFIASTHSYILYSPISARSIGSRCTRFRRGQGRSGQGDRQPLGAGQRREHHHSAGQGV